VDDGDRRLVFDIETLGLPWDGKLVCLGWKYANGSGTVTGGVENMHPANPSTSFLHELLADSTLVKVTQTKYDARWLRLLGVPVEGPFHDTQVMAWRLNENTPLSLEYLVKRYLHKDMDKRLKRSAGELYFQTDAGAVVPFADAPYHEVAAYCMRDVEDTDELYLALRERLQSTAWWAHFTRKDVPFTEVLLDMECAGLPVSLADSATLQAELEPLVVELSELLKTSGDLPQCFNLNSGPQLAAYLFSKTFELTDRLALDEWEMGALKECLSGGHEDCDIYVGHIVDLLPKGFTVSHVGRTHVDGVWTLKGRDLPGGMLVPNGDRFSSSTPALLGNLRVLADSWVQELTRYRKATKVLTTYLRKFPLLAHEGRLYGQFNQTGTVTGRLSSSSPNLQNLPAHGELGPRVRALFQGDLIVGDYSQLEPRLMAHYSQDARLLKTYLNGLDIYQETAKGIFGGDISKDSPERSLCKTLILALGYGAGAKKLALILTVNGHPTTAYEAEQYLRSLRSLYHEFFQWREDTILRAKRLGYVTTIDGHMRRLSASFKDKMRSGHKGKGYGERQAVNAIIQGSAGDVVRTLMCNWWVALDRRHSEHLTLLAQVHDELVWSYDGDLGVCWVCREGETFPENRGHHTLLGLANAGRLAGTTFNLTVPLVFEPHAGESWLTAKEGLVLPEDLAEGDADTYNEEDE
jgi:DNA polymerase I-like protein with 3'-5' exonuclease and polymerase domains